MHIRQAINSDIEFIIEGIIASEKSGTSLLAYCNIFEIKETEFAQILRNILLEEIEEQEWFIPNFFIGEIDGIAVSCLSSWIEDAKGLSSSMKKAQALAYFLGDKWAMANVKTSLTNKVQIPRLKNAIQLENIYTSADFRGRGLAPMLIQFAIDTNLKNSVGVNTAEIQLMSNNTAALFSYTKCGFLRRTETQVYDQEILNLLPGNGKVSLTKSVSNGKNRD